MRSWFSILAMLRTVIAAFLVFGCWLTMASGQNRFVMEENQFNQWLYGGTGQAIDQDSEVTLMIEFVDRASHLTNEQKDKLRLAGQGDYARFKQDVDDLHSEVVGKSYDQNEIGNIYQKIQPLSTRYQAGLLGDKSLFSKVLQQILTPAQREEFEAAEAERRKDRHAAKIRLYVASLERSCPLTSVQRDALIELLQKETQPPLRRSEYDMYVVAVQVANLPDAKLAPILDKKQLAFVQQNMRQMRGMEAHLKRIGVLPK